MSFARTLLLRSVVLMLLAGASACAGGGSPVGDDSRQSDDHGDDGIDQGATAEEGAGEDAGKRALDAGKRSGDDAGASEKARDANVADAARALDGTVADAGKAPDPVASGGTQRGPAPTSASASTKGPYVVKTYSDGYRDGPKYFDSTIHYPTDAEPPFAIIAIVPGFVSPQASIQNWGPFLASHGIVTMTIGTNTPVDQPPDREAALLDALETLKGEQTRDGSPLKGKLDLGRQAVGGWSMGGGGTLLAAEHTPSLKAALAICPWNPLYSYAKVKVPSLMFAGTLDALAGGQSQGFYESIPEGTPKLLWEVNGADHWYANDPAGQGGAVGRYGLSFLKVFLEGDERYRPFLKEQGPNASDFRTNM